MCVFVCRGEGRGWDGGKKGSWTRAKYKLTKKNGGSFEISFAFFPVGGLMLSNMSKLISPGPYSRSKIAEWKSLEKKKCTEALTTQNKLGNQIWIKKKRSWLFSGSSMGGRNLLLILCGQHRSVSSRLTLFFTTWSNLVRCWESGKKCIDAQIKSHFLQLFLKGQFHLPQLLLFIIIIVYTSRLIE